MVRTSVSALAHYILPRVNSIAQSYIVQSSVLATGHVLRGHSAAEHIEMVSKTAPSGTELEEQLKLYSEGDDRERRLSPIIIVLAQLTKVPPVQHSLFKAAG